MVTQLVPALPQGGWHHFGLLAADPETRSHSLEKWGGTCHPASPSRMVPGGWLSIRRYHQTTLMSPPPTISFNSRQRAAGPSQDCDPSQSFTGGPNSNLEYLRPLKPRIEELDTNYRQ